MIWLFLICLAALVLVLEKHWAEWSLAHLHYSFSCDDLLAEPEQVLTLTSYVENRWLLPILYLRILEYFPPTAQFLEDEKWMAEHVRTRPLERYVADATYLLPRRRRVSRLRFSLPQRGWYRLGGVSLSAGDFLGMKEQTRREEATGEVIIIPKRCDSPDVLRTLGGFLGDISVRRFILEDPILTVGFREYTGREPMKAISWTQSARVGQLLVKQYDYTVDVTVTVLFNTEGGTREQLEQCYCLVRTVCEALESKGIPYDFRTNGDLTGPIGPMRQVNEGLGRQHLNTILYGLGRANCRCADSLEHLVEQSLRSARLNQSYLVVTPPMSPRQNHLLERLRAATGGQVHIFTGEEVAS